jgi:hypothetical protein
MKIHIATTTRLLRINEVVYFATFITFYVSTERFAA